MWPPSNVLQYCFARQPCDICHMDRWGTEFLFIICHYSSSLSFLCDRKLTSYNSPFTYILFCTVLASYFPSYDYLFYLVIYHTHTCNTWLNHTYSSFPIHQTGTLRNASTWNVLANISRNLTSSTSGLMSSHSTRWQTSLIYNSYLHHRCHWSFHISILSACVIHI